MTIESMIDVSGSTRSVTSTSKGKRGRQTWSAGRRRGRTRRAAGGVAKTLSTCSQRHRLTVCSQPTDVPPS